MSGPAPWWFAALRALADLPPDEQVQAFTEDSSLVAYVHTALYEYELLLETVKSKNDDIRALARCAKCGAAEPMIRYHAGAGREDGCGWYALARSHEPHLHFTCRTCMHEWIGHPLDARAVASSQADPA